MVTGAASLGGTASINEDVLLHIGTSWHLNIIPTAKTGPTNGGALPCGVPLVGPDFSLCID